jgi:predicted RNase H-like HicB family nuclease
MISRRQYSLEYWRDGKWFVGRLREIPGVFSQGATLQELEENIRDAFRLMMEDQAAAPAIETTTKQIEVEVQV